jgi:membrane-associated phospholipid phosphatase
MSDLVRQVRTNTLAAPVGRALLLAGAALAILVGGLWLVCPGPCRALPFDAALLDAASRWRSAGGDWFFIAATGLGSLSLLLPLALVVAWQQWRQRPPRGAAFVPLTLLSAALLSYTFKLAGNRPRPDLFDGLVALPVDASFPSGHAVQATAFALAWLLRPGAGASAGAVGLACAWIALVATSRIYLQVHFPTDVLFGVAAAACWVFAVRALPVWQEKTG